MKKVSPVSVDTTNQLSWECFLKGPTWLLSTSQVLQTRPLSHQQRSVAWVTGSHSFWARLPTPGIPVLTLTDVMAVSGWWGRNSVSFPTGAWSSNKWLCIFSCLVNIKAMSKENLSTLPREATGGGTLPVCMEHGDGRPHLTVVPATHRLVLMSTQGPWAW